MGTASNEEIIYGKNAVTEALKAEKPIDTVFVLKGAQGMNQIIALAKKQGIVVKDAGEDKLKALCGDKHGGVAAALSAVSYCTVEDILANAESKGKPPFIIICDEIQDPHNLGARCRRSYYSEKTQCYRQSYRFQNIGRCGGMDKDSKGIKSC